MAELVAFLRGMNVGGHRITNDVLSAHVEALGFGEVATFQASGNVLIGSAPVPADAVGDVLSQGLQERLGYAVPVFVRSASQVRSVVTAEPFGTSLRAGSKPQVMFCAADIEPASAAEVLMHASAADELAVVGSEIHWRPELGISTSELDVPAIERIVGGMTIRTLGTVQRIVDRL